MEKKIAKNFNEAVELDLLSILRMYKVNKDLAIVFRNSPNADSFGGRGMCSDILRCKYSERYIGRVPSCRDLRNDPNNMSCSMGLTSYYTPSLYMSKYLGRLCRKGRDQC